VPEFLTDPEHVQPCPCGQPPDATVILFEGESGLSRWLHERCLDWIECELSEEQIEMKHEWERRRREKRLQQGFEDDDEES